MTNTPISNLPITESNDSAAQALKYFNTYYEKGIAVPSDVIDGVVGFFKSRGFQETAAQSVASVLLSQAKVDNVNVFTLLDTLKGLTEVQLSYVVAQILNLNRLRISALATKVDNSKEIEYEKRNIIV